jgi:hypothetical protein
MAKINSKKKGSSGELECVHILDEKFGKGKFFRVPASGARVGGFNREKAFNISKEAKEVLSGDIITPTNFKFSIEHKFYANSNFFDLFNEKSDLQNWFNQAEGDAKFSNKEPMLVVKYNGKKRIVFVKVKLDKYVFETKGWFCLWFSDLLLLEDSFFFNE